jgi:hypothetical protein
MKHTMSAPKRLRTNGDEYGTTGGETSRRSEEIFKIFYFPVGC